nr:uncharacterized protein LOC119622617 [Chlorocebus sabaeus]
MRPAMKAQKASLPLTEMRDTNRESTCSELDFPFKLCVVRGQRELQGLIFQDRLQRSFEVIRPALGTLRLELSSSKNDPCAFPWCGSAAHTVAVQSRGGSRACDSWESRGPEGGLCLQPSNQALRPSPHLSVALAQGTGTGLSDLEGQTCSTKHSHRWQMEGPELGTVDSLPERPARLSCFHQPDMRIRVFSEEIA